MATFEENLEQARVALHNAANDGQLLATLSLYGYSAERLQEGIALYESTRMLAQNQNGATYNRANVRKNFEDLWKEAKFQFQRDAGLARYVFGKDESSFAFLQLKSTGNRDFVSWYKQAKNFYFGLNNQPELQSLLAPIGLTSERIEQGINRLQKLEEIRLSIHTERGSEADIRAQRREAFQALHRWMVNFRTIARVAFASQPALLAKLAINSDRQKPKKQNNNLVVPPVSAHQEFGMQTIAQ